MDGCSNNLPQCFRYTHFGFLYFICLEAFILALSSSRVCIYNWLLSIQFICIYCCVCWKLIQKGSHLSSQDMLQTVVRNRDCFTSLTSYDFIYTKLWKWICYHNTIVFCGYITIWNILMDNVYCIYKHKVIFRVKPRQALCCSWSPWCWASTL